VAPATATDTTNPKNIPSFTVTTQSGCPFVASTNASWLHVVPPSSGGNFAGTSQVSFSIDQNTSTQLRVDQILIYVGTQITSAGPSLGFTVIQVAGVCIFSISPGSANLPVTGGSGSIAVTSGCSWNAAASGSFITLTAPNGTLGNAPIDYQAGANVCVAPRAGQVILEQTGMLNPPVFQLTQDGAISNLTLSATNLTIGSTALANQRVSVTTGAGCPWTTYTDAANWLHAGTPTSGSGNGNYNYSVDANQGGQRTGHVYFQSGTDLTGNPILAATLTITQQEVQNPAPLLTAILNGASFVTGPASPPISPGEIVALFGSNLGPASGASNTQTFGTSLAGVQVLFGTTPAPLIYVSAQQINAVVPYAVSGASVAVTVQSAGITSPALTVPVQAATPGIFSYDHSGSGPGAIQNQDYTLNSAAHPAAVGTVVALYCTGGGVTTPASTDGAITTLTPPFPTLATHPVTVTIGGVSAQVIYAGPAPGAIAGLIQFDAVVPTGVKSGPSVPVILSIGGVPSQSNLSLAVQ